MTKPKTPLIGLQGGLVLSALRKKESKKKMSDEPFAWFPWLAESADEKREEDRKVDEVVQTVEDDPDRDLQRAIALPPSLTRVRKTRSLSNASAFSIGSWEPLDLTDLEPAESEDSQDESPTNKGEATPEEEGASTNKAVPTKDVPQTPQGRTYVSYFASHVSVVIVILSLSFFGANSPGKESSLAAPIRGAVAAENRSSALLPSEFMAKNHTFSRTLRSMARTSDAILRKVEHQIQALDAAGTMQAIQNHRHSVVSFLMNPAGQKDLPPLELMEFVDSMMLL